MSIHHNAPAFTATFFSERRRSLELSAADLAARCRMTPALIQRLEQGRFYPSPSQAFQLARALDLDPVAVGAWAIAELMHHPESLAEHVLGTRQDRN